MKNTWYKFFHLLSIAFVLLGVTTLMACSSTSSLPVSSNSVTLSNLAFSPATLTVKVGATVTWTNNDISMTYNIISDSGVFQSSDLIPTETFSYTFNNVGTFAYHCGTYIYMKGSIVVVQQVTLAEGIKDVVKVPVIRMGNISEPEYGRIIREGNVDMVVIGRTLFSNPDFP